MSSAEEVAAPLRVGLIGTGFGSRVHLPAFALCKEVEVVAICSAKLERAQQAAEQFGVRTYTDDYLKLIERDDVDLVDVATPPDSHHEIATAALAAGKHVLCEKPMALDAEAASDMTNRARRSGRLHALNHEMRYLPVRRRIRDLVAEGFLGRPQYVVATVHADHGTNPSSEPYYWGWVSVAAKGGGALMGLLSHHLDLIRFCFGDFVEVSGRTKVLITERPLLGFEYRDGDPIGPDTPTFGTALVDADDTAVVTAVLASGALVTLAGSWSLHHGAGIRLEAYGDEGSLHLLPDGRLLAGRKHDAQMQELSMPPTSPAAAGQHPFVAPVADLMRDVVATLAGGGDGLFATFDDGWQLQQVIDAIKAGTAPVVISR